MPTFIEFLLQFRIGNCQRKDMILVFHCCVISYLKPSNFRQVTPKEWFKTTPLYYLIFFCGSKVQACCKLGSLVKVSFQGSLFKVSVQLYFCLELRVNVQVHQLLCRIQFLVVIRLRSLFSCGTSNRGHSQVLATQPSPQYGSLLL